MTFEQIDKILEEYGYSHDGLIGIMQDIQRLDNYLPMETLRYVSDKLEVPLARVYQLSGLSGHGDGLRGDLVERSPSTERGITTRKSA